MTWHLPALRHLRALHPGAWWLWAPGLATAASRTTNPLLLGLIVAVAGCVVAARRTDAPWARSYGFFLRLGPGRGRDPGGVPVVFGGAGAGHVAVHAAEVPLPTWAAGVRLGGAGRPPRRCSARATTACSWPTMLACVGAANALASPRRLLQPCPARCTRSGVAVVVALTFAPQLVERRAAGCAPRGGCAAAPTRGLRGLRGLAHAGARGRAGAFGRPGGRDGRRGYGRTRRRTAAARRRPRPR